MKIHHNILSDCSQTDKTNTVQSTSSVNPWPRLWESTERVHLSTDLYKKFLHLKNQFVHLYGMVHVNDPAYRQTHVSVLLTWSEGGQLFSFSSEVQLLQGFYLDVSCLHHKHYPSSPIGVFAFCFLHCFETVFEWMKHIWQNPCSLCQKDCPPDQQCFDTVGWASGRASGL